MLNLIFIQTDKAL